MKDLTRYQILAFLPLIVLLAIGSFFHRLVAFAIGTNPALNAIILGAMLTGVALMHQQIWSIRRQSRMANKFMERVEGGETIPSVLHDKDLGTSDIGLVCGHLSHVSGGVGGRPVAAVEAGLRSLQVTLDSRQELAQFLVGFLIALGLLGTFVGILETLVEIGNMIGSFASTDINNGDIDKSFMGLIADLIKPLKGMGTAFSASMFGLIGSLCLGLTMVAVRRCTEEFLTGLRHAINEMIKEHVVSDQGEAIRGRRRADLTRLEEGGHHVAHHDFALQAELVQKMAALEQRLTELSAAVSRQAEATGETNSLLRENAVTRQAADHFLGQVKVLATAATENSANVGSLLPALTGITQQLSAFSTTLLQQREQMQQLMLNSGQSQDAIRNTLTALVEKENEIRSGMLGEIMQLRKFMLEMQPMSSNMMPLLSEISSRLNEHSIALNSQQETLRQMTQAASQSSAGIKTSVAEMLLDAEKSRQLQADMLVHLQNSQRAVAEIGAMRQALSGIAEALSRSVAASQALVEEAKSLRDAADEGRAKP